MCYERMAFDERLVLNQESKADIIYDEHLVRYQLAAKLASGKKVLDIACGSGYGAKILAQAGAAKVTAIDKSIAAIEQAKINYGSPAIEFKIGEAEKIAEENESFDLVVSFETIEHLSDPEKYLAEISRLIKKEGIALISTPNREVFGQKNPYHLHEYSRKEFLETLKKYFASVLILDQTNGLASFIKINDSDKSEINFSNQGEPLYFIAICARENVNSEKLFSENQISVNPAALNRMKNNPAIKFIDSIYSLIIKIPGIKK
ncbi:MAG TPA: class I SAM-dependent methyltransferase [Candidatus Methylomirabilis sp.]|nr:class I SAM-dependent methyltransferase [Candidatus Methylomirabilis sp.]